MCKAEHWSCPRWPMKGSKSLSFDEAVHYLAAQQDPARFSCTPHKAELLKLLLHGHYLKYSSSAIMWSEQSEDNAAFPSLSKQKVTFLSLCYLSAKCAENRQNCFFNKSKLKPYSTRSPSFQKRKITYLYLKVPWDTVPIKKVKKPLMKHRSKGKTPQNNN